MSNAVDGALAAHPVELVVACNHQVFSPPQFLLLDHSPKTCRVHIKVAVYSGGGRVPASRRGGKQVPRRAEEGRVTAHTWRWLPQYVER